MATIEAARPRGVLRAAFPALPALAVILPPGLILRVSLLGRGFRLTRERSSGLTPKAYARGSDRGAVPALLPRPGDRRRRRRPGALPGGGTRCSRSSRGR